MFIRPFIILASFLILAACDNDPGCVNNHIDDSETLDREKGIIVLSFDDAIAATTWLEYKSIFEEENVRATFFIDRYTSRIKNKGLTAPLLELQDLGHEIAYHSNDHSNMTNNLTEFGPSYFEDDFYKQMVKMQDDGFDVSTFAYPFGSNDANTDSLLSSGFDLLRDFDGQDPDITKCIRKEVSKVMTACSMDDKSIHDLDNFKVAIDIAEQDKSIFILAGHAIGEWPNEYTMPPETLREIIRYAKISGLEFKLYKDLAEELKSQPLD